MPGQLIWRGIDGCPLLVGFLVILCRFHWLIFLDWYATHLIWNKCQVASVIKWKWTDHANVKHVSNYLNLKTKFLRNAALFSNWNNLRYVDSVFNISITEFEGSTFPNSAFWFNDTPSKLSFGSFESMSLPTFPFKVEDVQYPWTMEGTAPKINSLNLKMMVWFRWFSFSRGIFSGSILIYHQYKYMHFRYTLVALSVGFKHHSCKQEKPPLKTFRLYLLEVKSLRLLCTCHKLTNWWPEPKVCGCHLGICMSIVSENII